MEIWATALIASAVVTIASMTAFARRPFSFRSPDPTFVEHSINETFAKILDYISVKHLDTHIWSIEDKLEPTHIVAHLIYCDEFENKSIKCDVTVTFDLARDGKNKSRILWSCQFKHWCDKTTAERLIAQTNDWLEALFETNAVEEKPEILNESIKDFAIQLDYETECRRAIETTFERLFSRLQSNEPTTQAWKLKISNAISPGLITCDLLVWDEKKQPTVQIATLTFNFSEITRSKTKVAWSYIIQNAFNVNEHQAVKDLTDDWLKLILTA